VVVEQEKVYRIAEFRWLDGGHVSPASLRIFPKGRADHPAVQAAAATTRGRRFLGWARFPAFQVEPAGGGDFVVHIVDLRYADRPGGRLGSVSIPVTVLQLEATEYRKRTSSTNSAVTWPSPNR
jgi:hypothetical protein